MVDIWSIFSRIPSLKIRCMWRETNSCTHFLAKKGVEVSNTMHVSHDNFPLALNLLLSRGDLGGSFLH